MNYDNEKKEDNYGIFYTLWEVAALPTWYKRSVWLTWWYCIPPRSFFDVKIYKNCLFLFL